MKFTILGPLSVESREGRLPFGSARRRRVLAMLVARAGNPITSEALSAAVWGDTEPAAHHQTLYWHIHQLRAQLGDTALITRRDHGYVLNAASDDIDWRRFEGLLADGTAAAEAGRHHRAATVLAEALALWSGTAYDGLTEVALLREESIRLEELRLVALQRRCAADLALGRHADLVGELSVLAAKHPFHEMFRAQLMLALYRCGRRFEALRAYQDGRRVLVDELGLEPGVELQRMHRAILSGDPILTPRSAAPDSTPAPVVPVPAELPVDNAVLVGRDKALQRLGDLLGSGEPAVTAVVNGGGGLGKSALAIRAAHQARADYPGGQLYIDLRGATPGAAPMAPREALQRMLRTLGVFEDGGDVDELAARFRSAVADRRMLVVLDDAADAGQIRPLLPGCGGCGVLVTSRQAMPSLEAAERIRLDVLDEHDAGKLLEHLIGATRVAAEPDAVARIAAACGGLPLALVVAAGRAVARPGKPLRWLAQRLSRPDRLLAELTLGDIDVGSSLAVGLRVLNEPDNVDSRRLFWLLCRHHGTMDVTVRTAARLAGIATAEAETQLDRLSEMGLMDCRTDGRYRIHELMRRQVRRW